MTHDRSSQTRSRMLDAAEAEFAGQGFDAATMDRIAAGAGVSKSHLYYHFDSKDELLTELFHARAHQVLTDKDAFLSGVSELDGDLAGNVMTVGIDALVGAHPRFLRVVVLECFRPGGRTDLVFALLKGFTDDTTARLDERGLHSEAGEVARAMTWFALLPILGELLVGAERARILGLDPVAEHAGFTRLMAGLYTSYLRGLGAMGDHAQGG